MEEVLLAKMAGAAYGFKSLHDSDFLGLGFQVDYSQILPLCIFCLYYYPQKVCNFHM